MATAILDLPSSSSVKPPPKIHISHTQIPSTYLDPSQPPTKRVPFRQIRNVPFVRSISVCMPSRVYDRLYSKIDTHHGSPATPSKLPHEIKYHKIISTLKDILSDYELRTGNYIMLAEAFPPSGSESLSANSTTMRFNRGTLIIEMSYEVYQRSGLTSPHHVSQVAGGGRKHDKRSARHKVEIDLRQTSMVKGKKAFDRLIRASEQVDGLREGRVWLVAELDRDEDKKGKKRKREKKDDEQPQLNDSTIASEQTMTSTDTSNKAGIEEERHLLSKYHPTTITDTGTTRLQKDVLIPSAISDSSFLSTLSETTTPTARAALPAVLEDDIYELSEYLSLLLLQSPRITKGEYGKVDPYLCQYSLPDAGVSADRIVSEGGDVVREDVYIIGYSGLISSDFVTQLVVDLIRRSRVKVDDDEGVSIPETDKGLWAAVQVNAHRTEVRGGTDGYTILLQVDNVQKAAVEQVNQESAAAEDNPVSIEEGQDDTSQGKHERNPAFKFVTCFEYVDSAIQ